MNLEAGKYIYIHAQHGQGRDYSGAIYQIINIDGKRPKGVREDHIGGFMPDTTDTFIVKAIYILNSTSCEAKEGHYYRLRNRYTDTWREAMVPPEKLYF